MLAVFEHYRPVVKTKWTTKKVIRGVQIFISSGIFLHYPVPEVYQSCAGREFENSPVGQIDFKTLSEPEL